jgi:hypothetical protein
MKSGVPGFVATTAQKSGQALANSSRQVGMDLVVSGGLAMPPPSRRQTSKTYGRQLYDRAWSLPESRLLND